MNYSLAPLLLSDDVKLIKVIFADRNAKKGGHTEYTYKCAFDVAKDDYVLTASNKGDKLGVARVVETDVPPDFDSPRDYAWVFAKVDLSVLDALLVKEDEATSYIRGRELLYKRNQMRELFGFGGDLKKIAFASVKAPVEDAESEEKDD